MAYSPESMNGAILTLGSLAAAGLLSRRAGSRDIPSETMRSFWVEMESVNATVQVSDVSWYLDEPGVHALYLEEIIPLRPSLLDPATRRPVQRTSAPPRGADGAST